MKKIISALMCALMLCLPLAACDNSSKEPVKAQGTQGLKIIATIFPQYDWTREILGERLKDTELTLLLDNGVDLHSYQPKADDMVRLANCDLFIYVGGESDEWVEDAPAGAGNDKMIAINLLETLGDKAKLEEHVEGMQDDHDHDDHDDHDEDHDDDHEDHDEDHDHEHEDEYDEHVWLSLKNAELLCREIADALGKLDPEHASEYNKNAEDYTEKLRALDKKYEQAVAGAKVKTLLFGDRFPFRYLTDDYGLDYYAAFSGCSAETEAAFETVVFLANKIDELGLKKVFKIESGDGRIARTIVDNTEAKDMEILSLDSMQGVTSEQVKEGVSYLSVMEKNLDVLAQALS